MSAMTPIRLQKSGLPVLLALLFLVGCDDANDSANPECETNCEDVDAGPTDVTGGSTDVANDDAFGDAADDSANDDAFGDAADADDHAPAVVSNTPLDLAAGVATNARISVTFSEAMDTSTLDTTTFALTTGDPAVAVDGRVTTHPGARVVFWSDEPLAIDTEYTATVTTGVESASGLALEMDHVWRFTTGDSEQAMVPVELGTAGDFGVLAKAAISTASASDVTGDLGISPAAATYVTGFSLIADATNVFSTSSQLTGRVYASDYEPPTPSNLTTAVGDMEIAFEDAAGRAADHVEEADGAIGGLTLVPGTYKWGTDVSIADDLTLDGSATDVWIFQVAGNLSIASAKRVNLTGGALARNVFWQISGKAEFGTTSHFEGIVMCQTGITLETGATINGRLLAQTAVSLDASEVIEPVE